MKICIHNFNGILDELAIAIHKSGDLVKDWHEADTLVLWQDVIGELEDIASQAKNMGKRVIVAEHGWFSGSDYFQPNGRTLVADKFMTWGEWPKEQLIKRAGIESERIVVTGTLLTNKIIPRREHKDKRVLFAPRHWGGELQENLDVANELKKCKYTVFSKLLEGENNPQNYPHPMSTDRQGLNHIETCFDVLSWADVVVGVGEGTFGALAHLMDIPYISVNNWRTKDLLGKTYTEKEFQVIISKACIQVPIESLNKQIELCIKDPDINKKDRAWFRKECLNYPGNPLKRMLDTIYEK